MSNIENALAEAMAESWMGDMVDCADVAGILVGKVREMVTDGVLTGIDAAFAAFAEMSHSHDWDGQVSGGFAATYDQTLDLVKERIVRGG